MDTNEKDGLFHEPLNLPEGNDMKEHETLPNKWIWQCMTEIRWIPKEKQDKTSMCCVLLFLTDKKIVSKCELLFRIRQDMSLIVIISQKVITLFGCIF